MNPLYVCKNMSTSLHDALKRAEEVYNATLKRATETIAANNTAYTAYIAARDLWYDIDSQSCKCFGRSSSCTGENCGDCSNCGYDCPPCNEGPSAKITAQKAMEASVTAHSIALAAIADYEAAEAAIKALPH